MDLNDLRWDYAELLKDDAWRARRLAEFFTIPLPDERKEYIRMVCKGRGFSYCTGFETRPEALRPEI